MNRLFLTLSRFAVCAWIGAAAMFVVTTVQEVTSPELDSTTKAFLGLLRFPTHYWFGIGLLAASFAFAALSGGRLMGRGRKRAILVLIAAAFLVLLADYLFVYGPIAEMLRATDAARPASFRTYHQVSEVLSAVEAGLALIAALLLCWPVAPASVLQVKQPSQSVQ